MAARRLPNWNYCQMIYTIFRDGKQTCFHLNTPVGAYGKHRFFSSSGGRLVEVAPLHFADQPTSRKKVEFVTQDGGDIHLSEVKSHWTEVLTQHRVSEPYWSIKWITEHVQKTNQSDSAILAGQLSREQLNDINCMLTQRLHRVPVQYIIGEWDFRNVTLSMRPPVFIPEPETEYALGSPYAHEQELVGLAIASCEKDQSNRSFKFLDFCCGSGAIAVSLLKECPETRGVAVDISRDAVLLSQENAARNGVEERLDVLHCSVAESLQLLAKHRTTFDLIISNPPYIASKRVPLVQEEVYRYVDHTALDGGASGLRLVTEILSISRHLLTERGELWLETEVGQTDDIHRLIAANQNNWDLMYHSDHCDWAHRYRFHKLLRSGERCFDGS